MERDLDLSKSNIDDQKMIAISSVLLNDKNIKKLDLSNNIFGDEGTIALSEMLKQNNTCEILNLNFNDIGQRGYKALAHALGQNRGLRMVLAIPIDYSVITPDVLNEFAKYLVNNTKLVALKLEYVYDDPKIESILERNRYLDWPNIKKVVSDIAIGLYPLKIPPYVILEIIDKMGYKYVPEIKKVEILQKVERFLKQ